MMLPAIDRQQVRQHFSEHAGEYDLYARVQKRVASRLIEQILDRPIVGPVIDVGTGTGEVARKLHASIGNQKIIVSDIAHDMSLTAHQHLPDSIAVDADAQALPFRVGSFGMVLSSSVFQWIEDLPTVFHECKRILRPGGQLAFAMFCDGTLKELGDAFSRSLEQCQSDWPNHFQKFPVPSEVESALKQSGLLVDSCHVEIETDYHASFRELMGGLKKIGAQNASYKRPAGLFPRRVMLEMERLYREQHFSDKGLPASYGVLYGVARKLG